MKVLREIEIWLFRPEALKYPEGISYAFVLKSVCGFEQHLVFELMLCFLTIHENIYILYSFAYKLNTFSMRVPTYTAVCFSLLRAMNVI